MTAQMSDIVKYSGEEYSLTESIGKGEFNLGDYNIKIGHSGNSGCYRGYLSNYEVIENCLYLEGLAVYTKHKYEGRPVPFTVFVPEPTVTKKSLFGKTRTRSKLIEKTYTEPFITFKPPPLNGVHPTESDFFDYSYEKVHLKVTFTGVFLLGTDFISSLYVHMGHHPFWKYEKVFALNLQNGMLIDAINISSEAANLRDSFKSNKDELEMMQKIREISSPSNFLSVLNEIISK